ncbi:unnamed protein product [Chrysoparadoxa australica]
MESFEKAEGEDAVAGTYTGPNGKVVEIRNIWAENLEEEFAKIRAIVRTHPYIAMDTEFPGIVARPVGDYNQKDFQYQTLRCNVDLLKIIQLGLCFADERGVFAEGACCWQFNFKFSLEEDMYAQDSIDLLKQSGINFEMHESKGIDVQDFGELMMMSGLILVDNVSWISFHSGYDFGYLLKVLTNQDLPVHEAQFFELLKLYFPTLYDIKYLMTTVGQFHGGLSKLGEDLQVERIGQKHQAGSDSLLTAGAFFKMCEVSFGSVKDLEDKHNGELFGYGKNNTVYRPGQKPSYVANGTSNNGEGNGSNNGNGNGAAFTEILDDSNAQAVAVAVGAVTY